jgi:NDP-sugar pyrophosphorylase family protein
MKAMILAAGLGTRLKPLTDSRPKALVELSGRTLLEITIERLKSSGVTELIINVHHFADMVVDYLQSKNNFGLHIEISREEVLLDTGGGLKKAAWFFLESSTRHSPTEPFILHNVDVISNIDLSRMLQFHNDNHALATLAVQQRPSSRQLLFNNDLQLVGRLSGPNAAPELISSTGTPARAPQMTAAPDPSTAASKPPRTTGVCHPERSEKSAFPSRSPLATRHSPLAFCGILIPTYLRLAGQNQKILAFRADEYYWRDLGRPSDLSQAALDLRQTKSI